MDAENTTTVENEANQDAAPLETNENLEEVSAEETTEQIEGEQNEEGELLDEDTDGEGSEEVVADEGTEDGGSEESAEEVKEEIVAESEVEPATTTAQANNLTYAEIQTRITEQAKAVVAAKLGVEFDEFNPVHMVSLGGEAAKIQQKHDAYQIAAQRSNEIFSKAGGAKFVPEWQGYMDNMPYREHKAMIDAEERGDYSLTLKHMETAAARKKSVAVNAGAKAESINEKKTPPKTISSGTGSAPAKRVDKSSFSLEDIGL